jgi:hypothetical protein
MAQELQHEITIGTSPLAAARVQAALVHGDIETGAAEPPGPHVKYVDKPGKDQSLSPPQLNAEGQGNCASIPRAVAPFVDASHVAVVPIAQNDGSTINHTFLIADAKPGESPIHIGTDGRALSPIPPERIIDPNVGHGMNDGKPLPPAIYQNAALAPIHPPGVPDLSHIHAEPADRAAEGKSYQGLPRLHTPETKEGIAVAVASHLAARQVEPPPQAEPRKVEDLYLAHPKEAEAERDAFPWTPTRRMVAQLAHGLREVVAGRNPAPLPGDPKIEPEHQHAAAKILEHVKSLAAAQVPTAPEAEKVVAAEKLAKDAERLKAADRTEAEHDVHATVVAETEAMLPGLTPHELVKALPRERGSAAPRASKHHDPFAVDDSHDFFFAPDLDDRGAALALPMSAALTAGLAPHHVHRELHAFRVGCPGDGHRCARPPRAPMDARMGGIGDIFANIFTGGAYGAAKGLAQAASPHDAEWREHHRHVEEGRRDHAGFARDWARRSGFEHGHGEHGHAGHVGGGHKDHRHGGYKTKDPRIGAWWEKHEGPPPGGPPKPHHHAPKAQDVPLLALVPAPVDAHLGAYRMHGWHGRDRHMIGPQGNAPARAVAAYRRDPAIRARVNAGASLYGVSAAQIRAAVGVHMGAVDVALGGGHGGGGHGGGSFGSAQNVAPDVGTPDPSYPDPTWSDPAMAGPGAAGSVAAGAGAAGGRTSGGSASSHPSGGSASSHPSGGSGHSSGAGAGASGHASGAGAGEHGGRTSGGGEGGGHASGGGAAGGHASGGHSSGAGAGERGGRPSGHNEGGGHGGGEFGRGGGGFGHGEGGGRVADRHWTDRFGRDRTGPIVLADWTLDGTRRHWRDRWGHDRFEPIVAAEYVTEIDGPIVDAPPIVAGPATYVVEPWWKRFFHIGAGEPHWRRRDPRFGAVVTEDEESSRSPGRAIRCACG